MNIKVNKFFIYVFIPLVLSLIINLYTTNKYYFYTKNYVTENLLKSDFVTLNMTPNKFEKLLIDNFSQNFRNEITIETGSYCTNNWCKFIKLFITNDKFIYFDNKQADFPGIQIRFFYTNLDELNKIIEIEKEYYEDFFHSVVLSCRDNLVLKDFWGLYPHVINKLCLFDGEYEINESQISVEYRINPIIYISFIYICILFFTYNINYLFNEIRRKKT